MAVSTFLGCTVTVSKWLTGRGCAVRCGTVIQVSPAFFSLLQGATPAELHELVLSLKVIDVPTLDETARELCRKYLEASSIARRTPA